MMTCHLTLFFAYFSVVLVMFWSKIDEFLEQLPMVYRKFCNVFISSHVILVFRNQVILRCFWCNSMQNHANWQNKAHHEELERQWMKIQEACDEITKWRNSFPNPKTNFKEESTQKDQEKG